jgi:hypothetical protein
MGNERPSLEKQKKKSPSPTLQATLIVGSAALLVVALVPRIGLEWGRETVAPAPSPQAQTRLQQKLKEIDDSEQYALVATIDGPYACLHSGHTTCLLKPGEIWKYGVTSKGATGRYASAFLVRNRVSYIVQYKGTYSECLKQEQIKLFNYPFLPENLARLPADRLPRPPYNRIMR